MTERFPPTSGRIIGWLGVVTTAVIFVAAVVAWSPDTALGVALLAALGGVLSWASLLRPAVWATGDELVLRGMFQTDRIPLAAVDRVVITQVLAVWAGDKRYVSPAIGHSARDVIYARRRPGGLEQQGMDELQAQASAISAGARGAYQAHVEERIRHLADEARTRAGVRRGSPEQEALASGVRRTWAWPELVGSVVLVLAFVVWLAL
ncbi:hypothetical protein [Nocardioides mangrovi]|uniref:PH domain-containing protein n=1 Tax=Nocardioides mangrovi TaxID=2874580 RepID=A0ABS7UL05_9ACTN|nr:hypothetical protein [Nocardioides mangrovi]MBZ5741351.1 hypothetical protein [Nocardioides mangrovi]